MRLLSQLSTQKRRKQGTGYPRLRWLMLCAFITVLWISNPSPSSRSSFCEPCGARYLGFFKSISCKTTGEGREQVRQFLSSGVIDKLWDLPSVFLLQLNANGLLSGLFERNISIVRPFLFRLLAELRLKIPGLKEFWI